MRKYPQWFIDMIYNKDDKERAIRGDLTSSESIQFYCERHGVYSREVRDVVKIADGSVKGGCPKCGRQGNYEFPQWFIDEISPEFKERAIKNNLEARDVVTMVCPKHGEYQNTVGHLVKKSTGERIRGCPKCKRNIPDWVQKIALEDVYSKDSRDKIRFWCSKHGEYTMRLGDKVVLSTGKQKTGCPMCVAGGHQSYIEKEIGEYLRELGVEYNENQRGLITTDSRNYEIDIYIPQNRIGIEVNGSYWHASYNVSESTIKDKDYHFRKFRAAEQHGIHLIQIFDVDYIRNKQKIFQYLKDILTPKQKIYARDCKIKEVDKKEANEFFEQYHVQGKALHNNYNIGLYYKGDLYSVMGVGKVRYGLDGIELHRYCIKTGYVVVGGANKLFKSILSKFPEDEVLSYSDNDYFTGAIYERLGFSFEGYTNPRYYWVDRTYDYRTREQCMLKELKKKYPDLYQKYETVNVNKEDAIMAELKFYKVYRSGNKIWRYKRIFS